MKGIVVAINHQLGTLVVETPQHRCAILDTLGRISADIGDEMDGDWAERGKKLIDNITQGNQMQMTLQEVGISRNEAVGRMTVL
ncbi:MAG: hypothetical protein JKY27_03990 [Magnetovibrio sp.]|nr:hypothetical protein [Magnetovibrio sp.]